MPSRIASLAVTLAALPRASADDWAVIAVGSKGFMNYRHQADGCHAYHVLRTGGIPADHIILMMEDDVANSWRNPIKGALFNKPGDNPPNVYEGCKIDYRGHVVTKDLYLKVLTGKAGTNGPVLQSGPEDRVFLNYIDHGGVGIVAFPNGPLLHVTELSGALTEMREKNMYKELVFYMEACESGSMFPHLPADGKIFAMTAANAAESSWAAYCPGDDVVKGTSMGTCLGDLFSIAWMEDCDSALATHTPRPLEQQVQRVTNRTNRSHVMTFGDSSFEDMPICNVSLDPSTAVPAPLLSKAVVQGHVIDVHDVPLLVSRYRWQHAKTDEEIARSLQEYEDVVAARAADDATFLGIAHSICRLAHPTANSTTDCEARLLEGNSPLVQEECHARFVQAVHEVCPRRTPHSTGGWNGYNMKYSRVLANICDGMAVTPRDLQATGLSDPRFAMASSAHVAAVGVLQHECKLAAARISNKLDLVIV